MAVQATILGSAIGEAIKAALPGNSDRGTKPTLKTSTTIEFPTGKESHLEDLDSWFAEFDRIAYQLAGGRQMPYRERVTHLVAAWPESLLPGKAMRRIRGGVDYRRLESEGREKECYDMVVAELLEHAVAPRVARRRAQTLYKELGPG